MNRLLWGIAFLVLAAAGGWAQSTWRGQAEIWTSGTVPSAGFVAASNEFPKNSLLTVENYKTKKTVQVRVVQSLPPGSAALVLLNPRAAQALDMKAGDTPLVGVRLDPTGIDRPDNPDPDVNPLAERPVAPVAPKAAETPAPKAAVPVAAPTAPAAAAALTPAPTEKPQAADTAPRVAAASSLETVRGATALDPALLPLPTLAAPEPVAEPAPRATPLAVADEPETPAPVTPGKTVFMTTRETEPVAAETAAVTEEAPPAEEDLPLGPVFSEEELAAEVPVLGSEVAAAEEPAVEPAPETEAVPEPETLAEVPPADEPEPEAVPAPSVAESPAEEPFVPEAPEPAVAEAPAAEVTAPAPVAPEPEPVAAAPAPVTAAPEPVPAETPAPAAAVSAPAASPLPAKPAAAWVSVPGKLEGPVLGQVSLLGGLDRGRSYVQVGAWADEASVLSALATVKSFVPLSLYKAEGQKNPWRIVVASAPKGQLGLLLMHFRSQGYRTASLVKG